MLVASDPLVADLEHHPSRLACCRARDEHIEVVLRPAVESAVQPLREHRALEDQDRDSCASECIPQLDERVEE
jgi:hypothetical protein